jgi:hypothetical protein
MRALPQPILDALASNVQAPSLQAIVKDTFDRPDMTAPTIQSGDGGRSAMVQLRNGTYIQAYVNQPGLWHAAQVYTRAVTTPTVPSGWGNYNLRKDGAEGQAGVALSLDPVTGATARLFYQRLSDQALCYQDTTDGVSWIAEQVVASPGKNAWALASGSLYHLFAALNHVVGDQSKQDVVQYAYSVDLGWSGGSVWTNPPVQISGLSCVTLDFVDHIAVGALTRDGGALCFSTMTQAGGSWTVPTAVHPLDDPTLGISSLHPSLSYWDGAFHATATHYDSGAVTSEPKQHTELWTSPDFIHWHLDQLLSATFENGSQWNAVGAGWAVTDAGRVILSQAATGALNAKVDVSDDLLHIEIHEPRSDIATATVTLSNDRGQYSGATGSTPALKVGSKVEVSFGYAETNIPTHALYIDQVKTIASGDDFPIERIELELSNRGHGLSRQVPFERNHAGVTLGFLTASVAVAAGIKPPPALPSTPQFSQTLDTFAQPIGSKHHANLTRLASAYGFEWYVDQADTLQVAEPQLTDPVCFTYDGTAAQLHSADFQSRRRHNHIRVTGHTSPGTPAPFAEATDYADIQDTGAVHYNLVADRLLTTPAQCQIRADLELRKAQRAALAGTVRVPLNPGHQVLDPITTVDETHGSVTSRIHSLTWIADMITGEFDQVAETAAL